MKQDMDWVTISESFDPNLLFKLIEKFVLKQFDNQYKTVVLIAEQLSIFNSVKMINWTMQPIMIASPQGWKWLVRQECVTTLWIC